MRIRVKFQSFLVFMVLFFSGSAFASEMPTIFRAAPLSKAFVEHLSRVENVNAAGVALQAGRKLGYFPSPVDLSHLNLSSSVPRSLRATRAAFPEKHDPRREGNLLTPAKNQEPYENCWAYAALGALETAYKKKTGKELDLSEKHLTWYAYMSVPGLTYDPDDGPMDTGGTDNAAVAALARWIGAVPEEELPKEAQPQGLYSAYDNTVLLEDAFVLSLQFQENGKFASEVLKQLVSEYGAASVGVFFDDAYYNDSTNAYYCRAEQNANHAVLLVGWDDAFPKDNFREGVRPSNDGAWLIRNSWGTDWGDGGYFWVSYEDKGFGDGVVYLASDLGNYDEFYEHDELGWCYSVGTGGDTAWFANVFNATNATQMLDAISLYTTSNNAEYEIYVYTDLSDPADPVSGKAAATLSGKEAYAGYHTIKLPSRVEISASTYFAIAVKMRTPGYASPLAVEARIEGYSENAAAKKGESFLSADGKIWTDAAVEVEDEEDVEVQTVNACIKAFVTYGNGGPGEEALPNVSEKPKDWKRSQVLQSDGSVALTLQTPWRGFVEGIMDLSVDTTGLADVSCRMQRDDTGTYYLLVEGTASSVNVLNSVTINSMSYKLSSSSYFTFNITPPVAVGQMPRTDSSKGGGGGDGGGCDAGLGFSALLVLSLALKKRRQQL